jgi:hypothetical protein
MLHQSRPATLALPQALRGTVLLPPELASGAGPADTPPEVVASRFRMVQLIPLPLDPMDAPPCGMQSWAVTVPGSELARHSPPHAQRHRELAFEARGCAVTCEPSVAMRQPDGGEPIPAAKVAEDCGIPQSNKDEIPTGFDESTSWRFLRKETLWAVFPQRGTTLFRFGFGYGKEFLMGQTGISRQKLAAIGTERLSGERGCLAREVRFAEDMKSNAVSVEPIGGCEEVAFGRHPAQNKVRVRMVLW